MAKRNKRIPSVAKTFNQALDSMGAFRIKRRRRALPKQSEARGVGLEKYGPSPDESLMASTAGIVRMSMPERRVYGWLVRHKIDFESQVPLLGGRMPGGAVIDFIIAMRQPPIALRVMSYWHTSPASKSFDDYQKQAVEDEGYQIEDVWEYELSTPDETNHTMMRVLYGAPKSQGALVGGMAIEEICPHCGRPGCFQCTAGSWWH